MLDSGSGGVGIVDEHSGKYQEICRLPGFTRGLDFAGLVLDPRKNQLRGKEGRISSLESSGEIWVVPTNEELVVAMQTESVLSAN